MTDALSLDKLTDDAICAVPNELQGDLKDWLSRARKGELSELTREMLGKAEEMCRAFDKASKDVERKLQQ